MSSRENGQDLRLYFSREPLILALLFALAIVLFLAVGGVSRVYHTQQEALGRRWFTRGLADLKAQHFDRAVIEFRTALLYSRDEYSYRLYVAEALLGLRRTDEAYSYLINLWERQPENGLVNLELARIAAQRGQAELAQRYYHNAIYATWPVDQEMKRREARLELIQHLLGMGATTQAQSELLALAANSPDDPSQQAHIGELFLQANDYEHALAEYRQSLKAEHHNPTSLAGAGAAAFHLGRYALAQRYLQAAVIANPADTESGTLLTTAELVLQFDPFQRQLSVAQRDRHVVEAVAAAGRRLEACPAAGAAAEAVAPVSPTQSAQTLAEVWKKMKPQITQAGLRHDPDRVEVAMDLVFRVERETSLQCGSPTGADLALLLIAKLHEGN